MFQARTTLLTLAAAALALLAWLSTRLPDPVASHFGVGGEADALSSRGVLLAVLGVTVVADLVLFLALPALIRRTPGELVSMPHRDHWLALERREATLRDLGARLTWLGAIGMAFLLALTWEVGRANLDAERAEGAALGPGFWVALIAFVLAIGWWTRALYARFGPPP